MGEPDRHDAAELAATIANLTTELEQAGDGLDDETVNAGLHALVDLDPAEVQTLTRLVTSTDELLRRLSARSDGDAVPEEAVAADRPDLSGDDRPQTDTEHSTDDGDILELPSDVGLERVDDAAEAYRVQGIDVRRLDMDDSLDVLSADLQMLLKDGYLSLIQQLVASPTASLSLPELAARNPDVPESTLYSRLNTLADRQRPLVIKLRPDVDAVPKGYPQVYYAASQRAVDLLKQIGLFKGCYRLLKLYEHATVEHPNSDERTVTIADIEAYDHRPIPEWATCPQTD
jgi:hypothetical protein